jgi:hypothetical protein
VSYNVSETGRGEANWLGMERMKFSFQHHEPEMSMTH